MNSESIMLSEISHTHTHTDTYIRSLELSDLKKVEWWLPEAEGNREFFHSYRVSVLQDGCTILCIYLTLLNYT